MRYDAFISYSHAADGKLAPALRSGLHRFAKPWYRLRALHVFHDTTNLALTPQLWSSITAELDRSDWFILLASPGSAGSIWVDREIEYWIGRRPVERVLMVLTDGTLAWDANLHQFDVRTSSAVPPRLVRGFADEPLYLDLSWARNESHLSLSHPRFRDAVAEIAATLTGRPKEELIGEDVRLYRRTRRLAWSVIVALSVLTLSFAAAAWFAVRQRRIAESERAQAVHQSNVATAGRLAAESRAIVSQHVDRLPLAVLLAVESTRVQAGPEGNLALRAAMSLLPRPVSSHRSDGPDAQRVRALAFSNDGRLVAAARDDGTLDLMQTRGGKTAAPMSLSHEERPGEIVDLPGNRFSWKAPGMGSEATSAAFSPDGLLIASGSNDGQVRIRDTANARELKRLLHDDGVSTVAFSPAGNYLATGSKDATARLWEVASGNEVLRIKHDSEVRKVVFSADGRHLGVISTDGTISLVDVVRNAVRRRWAFGAVGLDLAFARGSDVLAASGEKVAAWNVTTGKLLFEAAHLGSPDRRGLNWIDAVALSPDGTLLASAGRDQTARVWELESRQELMRFPHGAPVEAVAFNSEGTLLGTASTDGTARLWDLSSGQERLRTAHPGGAEVIAFSPDGKYVASGAMDGDVEVWSLERSDLLWRAEHRTRVEAVAVSADDELIATSAGGTVRLWSSRGEPRSPPLELPSPRLERLTFSVDGTHLAASGSRQPFLIDTTGKKGISFTQLTRHPVGDVAISARHVAAFDLADRALRIWETASGRELGPVAGTFSGKLSFDSSGSFLAAKEDRAADDSAIRVWALPEMRETGRLPAKRVEKFSLGPEGKMVALVVSEQDPHKGSYSSYLDLLEIAGGRRIARIAVDEAVRPVFHPRGDALIAVAENEVRIFDLSSGRMRAALRQEEPIAGIRFSPDRETLATVSPDGVNVWNAVTGELLSQVSGDEGFEDAAFAGGGRYLLTGGAKHAAVLWLWKSEDLRDEACKRLMRNLAPDEWLRYLGDAPYRRSCPNLGDEAAAAATAR